MKFEEMHFYCMALVICLWEFIVDRKVCDGGGLID